MLSKWLPVVLTSLLVDVLLCVVSGVLRAKSFASRVDVARLVFILSKLGEVVWLETAFELLGVLVPVVILVNLSSTLFGLGLAEEV